MERERKVGTGMRETGRKRRAAVCTGVRCSFFRRGGGSCGSPTSPAGASFGRECLVSCLGRAPEERGQRGQRHRLAFHEC